MATKFETIGASMQYGACSKEHAQQLFENSCNACASRGMHIECERCIIKDAHELVVAIFDDMKHKNVG